jgi:surfactin synthase thioesterase subunit
VPLTGAVLQAGVLDLVRAAEAGLGGGAVGDFLGGSPADVAQAYAQASPTALVPLGVPSICVHGTADTTVPLEQSERFVASARAACDQTELQTFDGDHFAPITTRTEAWDLCVDAVTRLSGRSSR